MNRRRGTPGAGFIAPITVPLDVIASIQGGGLIEHFAAHFAAHFIPIQLHASVPPAQRAVASVSTGAADNSRAVA